MSKSSMQVLAEYCLFAIASSVAAAAIALALERSLQELIHRARPQQRAPAIAVQPVRASAGALTIAGTGLT